MKKILFVCTGNTCRSPMAQAIFESFAKRKYFVSSAGITATDGKPVSENSLIALDQIGLTSDHKSEKLTEKHLIEFDYIIGITADHARYIAQAFPEYKNKIFAFPVDVSDPYGGNLKLYTDCRDKIIEGIKTIIGVLDDESK